MNDEYVWPRMEWWKQKEAIAQGMTMNELHAARLDCHKAALAWPRSDTESKYHDEGSIYAMEMRHRSPIFWDTEMTAAYQRGLADGRNGEQEHSGKEMFGGCYRQGFEHGIAEKEG